MLKTGATLVTEPGDILEALGPAPVAINDIVRTSGLDKRTVRTALIELDVAGLTERRGALLVSLLAEETSN